MTSLAPRFDPALGDDPYPRYAELRAVSPVARAGPGMWAVTRHEDVAALLRDRRLGHEFPDSARRAFARAGGAPESALRTIVSGLEPPAHTRVRRALTAAFTPGVVRGMRAGIAAFTDAVLARARDVGRFDALADLALPLQTAVACDLVGVPEADRAELVARAVVVGRAFIQVPLVAAGHEAEVAWLRSYVGDLLADRRARPGADVLSRLAAGGLSDDEIVDNAVFLFFAGYETAVHLVAAGCAALLEHPEAWRALTPDGVPGLVEEVLRHDAPIQWVARVTSQPVRVGDHTLREGRAVLLLIGSANRDERRFPEPDRFRPDRFPNPHLSFGAGVHACLGAVLARAQGAMVFTRLAALPAFTPAGPAVRRPHPNLRGFTSVPVAVR
ncbi:cytochrome P450 [Actinosynnema sp. NPDC020468]|uniref:cytochrome P450 n=1 Tax=Actinosynnema sp. NPDC020468 TaxID=3154488 RepID=UPI00340935C8